MRLTYLYLRTATHNEKIILRKQSKLDFLERGAVAADYLKIDAFWHRLRSIINRVLGRAHRDFGVRLMLTASCPSRISSIYPRMKCLMLALTCKSIIRAHRFQFAIYHWTRILLKKSVDFYICVIKHSDEMLANRSLAWRQINDIYMDNDIVQLSFLSNLLANFIDIVFVSGRVGDISVHCPTHQHYMRLLGGELSSIEIRLCINDGNNVPIAVSKVLCQLQVWRVQDARI